MIHGIRLEIVCAINNIISVLKFISLMIPRYNLCIPKFMLQIVYDFFYMLIAVILSKCFNSHRISVPRYVRCHEEGRPCHIIIISNRS